MLKSLHKDDTQLTPFVVTKDWELSNVTNEDLILMEHSGSDGPPVALEYLNYTPSEPIPSSGCNIALEQQTADEATYRDGLKVQGNFYPDLDPQNPDRTYQRVIYAQVATMFYNDYRDPTKMWGLEKIDFELAKTKRFLSDKFKILEVPQKVFGEKVLENTIVMYDDTTDNDLVITDDGNCNLFAGTNIFSRQQELGEYTNTFQSGSTDKCDYYFAITVPNPPFFTSAVYSSCIPPFVYLQWAVSSSIVTSFTLERSTDGVNYVEYQSFGPTIDNYTDTNITFSNMYWYRMYASNYIGTSSFSSSISFLAYTGSGVWDTDSDFWFFPCNPIYWESGSLVEPTGSISLVVSSGSAILSWSYGAQDELGFNVQKSTDGINYAPYATSISPIFSFTDSIVSEGNTYWYRVNAYNTAGTSEYSNTASIHFVSPPPAPSNLSGIQDPIYNAAVQLTWSYDNSQSYAEGFLIYRSPVPISTFEIIQTITSSYVSTSLDSAVTYSNDYAYKVFAYTGSLTSSNYAGIFEQLVMPPPPLAPINLVVFSGSAFLTWDSGSNDQNYFAVYQSIDGAVYYQLATTPFNNFVDIFVTGSDDGTTYWYEVAAINDTGTSSFSNTASITFFTPEVPEAPINLTVMSGSAILNWESGSNEEEGFYVVQRSIDSINYFNFDNVIVPLETYTDTTVTSSGYGPTYWYRVAMVNEYFTSSFSNTASITFGIPLEAIPSIDFISASI